MTDPNILANNIGTERANVLPTAVLDHKFSLQSKHAETALAAIEARDREWRERVREVLMDEAGVSALIAQKGIKETPWAACEAALETLEADFNKP
jgi:hypothetical protein